MWIEICKGNAVESVHSESSPAGDVDWNTWILTMVCMGLWVISCGRCGLKYLFSIANQQDYIESSPAGDVDWNFIWPFIICRYIESSPAGDVDWNCSMRNFRRVNMSSHLLREMWIEIVWPLSMPLPPAESSPAGDVDWNCEKSILPVDLFESSPAGDVDWNYVSANGSNIMEESSPAGDVDWNYPGEVGRLGVHGVISCGRCRLKPYGKSY